VTRRFLLPLLLLSACDRTPPRPEPTPSPATFDNQTGQSIVRPEVIAEVEPTPTPTPSPTPAALPTATVLFPSGTRLDDAGRTALDALLADPALPGDARLVLRGHSDSGGSDADNLRASRRRAEAVRAYLLGKHVAADRMELIALGERRPVAPNALPDGSDDPAGRARNRRVEVEVLLPEPELAPAVLPK
jgi:OmpA-OmpF porin, OOP family